MANIITTRTLVGGGSSDLLVLLINIASDGTNETDRVIYDNSTFINNTAKGNLLSVTAFGSGSLFCVLEWDQTADSPILVVNPLSSCYHDFKWCGGISNPNAAGATGDILLTTAGLVAGSWVTLILEIQQNN